MSKTTLKQVRDIAEMWALNNSQFIHFEKGTAQAHRRGYVSGLFAIVDLIDGKNWSRENISKAWLASRKRKDPDHGHVSKI